MLLRQARTATRRDPSLRTTARRLALVAAVAIASLAAACSPAGAGGSASPAAGSPASSEPVELRLGYFPNLTHATALAGIKQGFFEDALPDNVTLKTVPFNAGPEAVEAIFSGGLDASFIGPNPAINAFAKSKGEAIRIVSGATSGGAYLVVKPEITSRGPAQGQEAGHAAARQHARRCPPRLAEGAGSGHGRPGRRRCLASCRRPTRRRSTPSSPATSTAPGCLSHGPRGSSRRAAARSSSMSGTCGRTAST